ncbi:hypothetical protein MGYG_05163 [Nannizzia gypsea CBS 118893]|uniref:DUF7707 domain-containing protein n=1 Tax=Arthroderma gypseum (strain ATCC MYA-4604 / CBS 118893) TaxID=535722 RepID=E4UYJ7_ARTGP|nr:hypothetical protein MGYG_05163 [Nannizzia gypsea CBS 118893]EFR02160.1 hypothetical protein MGYG_05163 [Nannizzia gypsea CBS 118893]
MFFPQALLAAVAVARLASAQVVNPDDVAEATRQQWCLAQQTSCPLICLQLPGTSEVPAANDCDPDTLVFDCTCSNGKTPNATEYSQTIPYFICTESNNKCVENCNGDHACQSACREDHPCGAQNPTPPNSTATAKPTMSATQTASSSATSGAVYTGFGDGSASPTDQPKKGMAGPQALLNVGQMYGMAVLATGFLAGFAVLL